MRGISGQVRMVGLQGAKGTLIRVKHVMAEEGEKQPPVFESIVIQKATAAGKTLLGKGKPNATVCFVVFVSFCEDQCCGKVRVKFYENYGVRVRIT